MTRHEKQRYLKLCMGIPSSWLRASAADPTSQMSQTHVAIQLIAARRQEGRTAPLEYVPRFHYQAHT